MNLQKKTLETMLRSNPLILLKKKKSTIANVEYWVSVKTILHLIWIENEKHTFFLLIILEQKIALKGN